MDESRSSLSVPRRAKKRTRMTGSGPIQQALEEVIDRLPRTFAAELFKKKLAEAGIKPTRKLVNKLVEHVLAGGPDDFEWPSEQDIHLTITADDLADLDRSTKAFLDELPALIQDIGTNASVSGARIGHKANRLMQDLVSGAARG